MLVLDVTLADHVVKLLHVTLPRAMHLTAGTTHEKTIVGGVSFTPTFLSCEPFPVAEISMLGRSAMCTRLR